MIKINCELCGISNERLNKALIEDVELNVCIKCSKFGRIIGSVNKVMMEPQKKLKNIKIKKKKLSY